MPKKKNVLYRLTLIIIGLGVFLATKFIKIMGANFVDDSGFWFLYAYNKERIKSLKIVDPMNYDTIHRASPNEIENNQVPLESLMCSARKPRVGEAKSVSRVCILSVKIKFLKWDEMR
jgi:hypothetical protein